MSELRDSIIYLLNTCESCKNSNDAWMDPDVIKLADACETCAKAARSRVSTFVIKENNKYKCSECGNLVSDYILYNNGYMHGSYCEHCGKALNWEDVRCE